MKITKKICSALLTISISMSFTGCKALGKVTNLDMPNNTEQFVERLKEAGIEYNEEYLGEFDGQTEYELDDVVYCVTWCENADKADEAYDEYTEGLERICSVKTSVQVGGHAKFTGSNKDKYYVAYIDGDTLVVATGDKNKKEEISKVSSIIAGEK